ncbi:MAG: Hpt domain-containing protein [Rhodanobacteraceae bacterium]|nr:Hpt domain-containing protein [Rhodanobacteraceae bacterium]MBP9153673.1 Hpt domain-containing protein [Xanthomonadales bacterium]
MSDVVINQAMLDQLRMLERAGKSGIFAQMIGMFVKGSGDQIAAVLAASDAGDTEKLRVASHTLKSNAASFGADDLAALCRDIETDARTGVGSLHPDRRMRLIDVHAASCAALQREIA